MDDFTRGAIVALGTVLLFTVNMRVARDWPVWNAREKVVRVHLNALLAVVVYGSLEAMRANVPLGLRVFLTLGVLTSFGICLVLTRKSPPTSRASKIGSA
jgi:hypothetical protein